MNHTIQTNSKTITDLLTRVHTTFLARSKSKEDHQAWQDACAEFHQRYDSLAFPGGLSQAIEKLKQGDLLTAGTAICFLEIHPYFFRSQYIATTLTRLVKKIPLPAHLQQRFETVRAAAQARKRRPRKR